MKKPLIRRFISYGSNPYSANISVGDEQQTWYANKVDKEFTCLLTGLTYYAGHLHWTRPGTEDIISGEGMIKLSYGRLL
jgi:hypothetical protein